MNHLAGINLRLLVFTLDAQRYALRLNAVERVVRAVYITPLPKAPEIVLGIVNVRGRILPVVNVRRRFRLAERAITPDDQFVIACTPQRSMVIVVDSVLEICALTETDLQATDAVVPGIDYIAGVVKVKDGLILVHDLATFLALDEESVLDQALAQHPTAGEYARAE